MHEARIRLQNTLAPEYRILAVEENAVECEMLSAADNSLRPGIRGHCKRGDGLCRRADFDLIILKSQILDMPAMASIGRIRGRSRHRSKFVCRRGGDVNKDAPDVSFPSSASPTDFLKVARAVAVQ
jgi:hypothetical protein